MIWKQEDVKDGVRCRIGVSDEIWRIREINGGYRLVSRRDGFTTSLRSPNETVILLNDLRFEKLRNRWMVRVLDPSLEFMFVITEIVAESATITDSNSLLVDGATIKFLGTIQEVRRI